MWRRGPHDWKRAKTIVYGRVPDSSITTAIVTDVNQRFAEIPVRPSHSYTNRGGV